MGNVLVQRNYLLYGYTTCICLEATKLCTWSSEDDNEDEGRYEDAVCDNDGVEIARDEDVGIEDVGFEGVSYEDTGGKDNGGGERPWIRHFGDKLDVE
ncbi:hypothetical protein QVD17_18770 [Tagetes erecta]|uniref:Uncharacterized protein n=1 Tax=Tagetes erecta TaxID=13708 RepID=A0AAD8NWC6_TARER|nr:hypothetical protein QVD17_18770 [Tagetes erecta]